LASLNRFYPQLLDNAEKQALYSGSILHSASKTQLASATLLFCTALLLHPFLPSKRNVYKIPVSHWQDYLNQIAHSNWSLLIFIVSLFIFLDYLLPVLSTQEGIKYVGKFQVKSKIALCGCYFFKVHTPSIQFISVDKRVFQLVRLNQVIELSRVGFHILPVLIEGCECIITKQLNLKGVERA